MKVLLVNPVRRGGDSYCTPPLHLLYISRAIREAGHQSEIFDAFHELSKRNLINEMLGNKEHEQQLIDEIIGKDFDVLGIGSIVSSYSFSENLVHQLKKKKDVPVIIGGGLGIPIIDLWEKYTDVDYIVASDGETVIQEFLDKYPDRDELEKIPGLCYRKNGSFVRNKPQLKRNLDYISFPDWNEIDYEPFTSILRTWINATVPDELKLSPSDRVLPIVTTRGCPYDCTFCYHFDRTHRKHSVDYVIKYFRHLKDNFGINVLQTWDDLIMADRKWFMDLCDELAVQNMGLKIFSSGGKPNLITKEILGKMKKAGFKRVSYGVESGSQKILDIMKKKTTVKQNHDAMQMTGQSGIFAHANIVLGMPGETTQTLKETEMFLRNLDVGPKNVSFAFATAYPGTELFEHLTKKYDISDLRQYLENVIGVGQYQYNFTDIGKYKLLSYPTRMLLSIELDRLRKDKKYIRYIYRFITGNVLSYSKGFIKTILPEKILVYIMRRRARKRK